MGVQLRISHLSLCTAKASQADANTGEITPVVHFARIWGRGLQFGTEALLDQLNTSSVGAFNSFLDIGDSCTPHTGFIQADQGKF